MKPTISQTSETDAQPRNINIHRKNHINPTPLNVNISIHQLTKPSQAIKISFTPQRETPRVPFRAQSTHPDTSPVSVPYTRSIPPTPNSQPPSPMPCNTMQCNTIQYNATQCDACSRLNRLRSKSISTSPNLREAQRVL